MVEEDILQTIPWLRSVTKLPIVLKGIQSVQVSITIQVVYSFPQFLISSFHRMLCWLQRQE